MKLMTAWDLSCQVLCHFAKRAGLQKSIVIRSLSSLVLTVLTQVRKYWVTVILPEGHRDKNQIRWHWEWNRYFQKSISAVHMPLNGPRVCWIIWSNNMTCLSYKLLLCRPRRIRKSHCKGSLKRLLLNKYIRFCLLLFLCVFGFSVLSNTHVSAVTCRTSGKEQGKCKFRRLCQSSEWFSRLSAI
jgi:hypothetical protein